MQLYEEPIQLPTDGTTSGSFVVKLPFPASYVAFLNTSGADLYIANGTGRIKRPPGAKKTGTGQFLAFNITKTQTVTVYWESVTGLISGNSEAVIMFSDHPLSVSGGNYSTGGPAANVQIVNVPAVTVSQMPANTNVTVTAQPHVLGSDYTTTPQDHAIKTDAEGSQYVVIQSDSAGLATENTLTSVDTALTTINTTLNSPAQDASVKATTTAVDTVNTTLGTPAQDASVNATAAAVVTVNTTLGTPAQDASIKALPAAAAQGFTSTNQVTVATTATPLFDAAVTGTQIIIQNMDTTNTMYIGSSSITTAIGFPIAPGQSMSFDIQSGKTINVYAIAAASIKAAIATIA